MSRAKGLILSGLLILFGLGVEAREVPRHADAPLKCMKCHSKEVNWHGWLKSAHAQKGLTCTDCHQGVSTPHHTAKSVKTKTCTDCHYWWKPKAEEFKGSVHAKIGANCASCHNPHADLHMSTSKGWTTRCSKCHKGNVEAWHNFLPKSKMHLAEHSCKVCHEDVHKIGKTKMATLTCSNCHPKASDMKAKVLSFHDFLPHTDRHLSTLNCEDCHRAKGPVKTCTDCHSSRTVLEKGKAGGAFTNPYTQKRYGYVIGANHLKWLDIIGILLFAGGFAVWLFHGGLRLLARALRRRDS